MKQQYPTGNWAPNVSFFARKIKKIKVQLKAPILFFKNSTPKEFSVPIHQNTQSYFVWIFSTLIIDVKSFF